MCVRGSCGSVTVGVQGLHELLRDSMCLLVLSDSRG